jgi:hypothetical protein
MFYSQEVEDLRAFYFEVWRKLQDGEQLLPLEQQIANVLRDHPEFHSALSSPDRSKSQQFYPELGQTNPFLHMGLHLAIREQIGTDRPQGILAIYQQLLQKYQDEHRVEHLMMEQLAEQLWLAQKNNLPPDESNYLALLSGL